ncbi:hypothetical protein vseg_021397 [Gypsophila vaccaria]
MIQGCFSNPSSPPPTTSVTTTTNNNNNNTTCKANLITCIYSTSLFDSSTHVTLTWSKTPSSHTLTIYAPDYFSATLSLLPSAFFRSRSGSKSIRLSHSPDRLRVYYDFTRARPARPGSAEPGSGFYLALARAGRVGFRLGDMDAELARRDGAGRPGDPALPPRMVSRREHVFGRRCFATRAEFLGLGPGRTLEIECSGGAMKVKFDGETKLHVKKLAWKFRGNEKIFIDGVMVEFYWDVFNWTNNNNNNNDNNNNDYNKNKSILSDRNNNYSNNNSNAVFVFRVGEGGVCPEVVGPERKLIRKNSPSAAVMAAGVGAGAGAGAALSPAGSCSSVWQWAEESSDCGRSSSGSSSTTGRSSGSFSGGGGGGGCSLVLYAWRRG